MQCDVSEKSPELALIYMHSCKKVLTFFYSEPKNVKNGVYIKKFEVFLRVCFHVIIGMMSLICDVKTNCVTS